MTDLKFSVLKGKTLANIEGNAGDDVMTFTTIDREVYRLSGVHVDVFGLFRQVVGFPLTTASVRKAENTYRLATVNGIVVLQWAGATRFERVS